MAQMLLPLMMDNQSRNSMMKVAKWIIIGLGTLGIGILLYVFIGKKFDPLKQVGNWLDGVGQKVGGFFGNITKSVGGLLGGATGGIKQIEDVVKKTAEKVTPEELRRTLKRNSKIVSRNLGKIVNSKNLFSTDIINRASILKTTFRKASKKSTKNVAKSISNIFTRKKSKKSKKKKRGLFG